MTSALPTLEPAAKILIMQYIFKARPVQHHTDQSVLGRNLQNLFKSKEYHLINEKKIAGKIMHS